MGTGRDNVSGWVRGTTFPRPAMMEKLAEALGLDIRDLVPPAFLENSPRTAATFQLVVDKQGISRLRLDAEMPTEAAMAIYNILREARVIT